MAPYMETSPLPSPLVSDGEIPGIYHTKAERLPELLSTLKDSPSTNGHRSPSVNGKDEYKTHSIPMNPEFAFTPRKLRIITIGAGFSGLIIAHKFQHRFPELQDIISHTIFEARGDLGGTWLVNTYPGVQCDVPAHIYVSYDHVLQGWLYLLTLLVVPVRPESRLESLLC